VIDWQQAPVPDDDLRLLLWMRLREAFGLDASTFGSLRSAGTAADDLVATLLASLQPGLLDKAKAGLGMETRTAPDSLDALARQTLDEMLAQVKATMPPMPQRVRPWWPMFGSGCRSSIRRYAPNCWRLSVRVN